MTHNGTSVGISRGLMRAEQADMVVLSRLHDEIGEAEIRYGRMASTHEALGVLLEEWDELRAAIHANQRQSIAEEAIQLAAVALRLAAACQEAAPAFLKRSGLQ